MGQDRKYYDVDDYLRWKRVQGKNNKVARPNLLAAANWLRKFFDARKTNWAAMGSLAMLCLGARREIPDIHIVYDDKEFQYIHMKLQADPRVRMPKGMNSMFSSKLLVSTGPKYKDAGCTDNADIEVEMIPPGSHATPPSDILRNNQAVLSLNLDGKIINIKGLNIAYLFNTTVHFCSNQDLLWDPKKDLVWLCRKYGKEIQTIRGQLNARLVKENFLGTKFFSTLPPEEQRRCYNILLGKEPPPSMFLTPAPAHEQPRNSTVRPTISSHRSAPSLNATVRQQSNFLKPPMHGKPKKASGAIPSGIISKASANMTMSPQTKATVSESAREPRSRYRKSTALAPSIATRHASLDSAATQPMERAIELGSGHMQEHSRIYQAQSVNIQSLSPIEKPQVVRTKKSLTRIESPPTSAQSVPEFAHKKAVPQQDGQTAPSNSSERFEAKSGSQHDSASGHSRNSIFAPATGPPPPVGARTHPAHKIMAQRNSMQPGSRSTPTVIPKMSHSEDEKFKSPSAGLAVVGPEGVYPTPPKPTVSPRKTQLAPPTEQDKIQGTSTQFVFELDAASPQVESFSQAESSKRLIAELPAEDTPLSKPALAKFDALPETPISSWQDPNSLVPAPTYNNSPVSPSTPVGSLANMIQPMQPSSVSGTPKTASTTEPSKVAHSLLSLDSLPPSLMIGFRGPQHSSNAKPRTRAESQPSNSSNPPTNFHQYQRYYTPPNSREASPNSASTSAPSSRHASPIRGPVYKAYTPPLTPPMQPKAELTQFQQPAQARTSHDSQPPVTPSTRSPAPQHGRPVPMDRASDFVGRVSPPTASRTGANIPQPLKIMKPSPLPNPLTANPPTPLSTSHTKHDSHQEHRAIQTTQCSPLQLYRSSPESNATAPSHQQPRLHQRNPSTQSTTSTTSHDSEKLAQEYQLDLPPFGNGFSAPTAANDDNAEMERKKAHRPSYAGTGYAGVYQLGTPDLGKDLGMGEGGWLGELKF